MLYCKGERTWDLNVPSSSSSEEESSTPINHDDDREEASNDEVFEFMGYEIEGEGEEEYMALNEQEKRYNSGKMRSKI